MLEQHQQNGHAAGIWANQMRSLPAVRATRASDDHPKPDGDHPKDVSTRSARTDGAYGVAVTASSTVGAMRANVLRRAHARPSSRSMRHRC